jgi:hypothetical protein
MALMASTSRVGLFTLGGSTTGKAQPGATMKPPSRLAKQMLSAMSIMSPSTGRWPQACRASLVRCQVAEDVTRRSQQPISQCQLALLEPRWLLSQEPHRARHMVPGCGIFFFNYFFLLEEKGFCFIFEEKGFTGQGRADTPSFPRWQSVGAATGLSLKACGPNVSLLMAVG